MKASDFSKFLTQYLTHYLPVQRNLSSNTICSYRDTFKLLLIFCRDEKGFNIAKLNLSKLDKKCIEDFLLWLTNTRGSSPSTYNQRLCAIHAFFDYVMTEEPTYMEQCILILKIPSMVSPDPPAQYLTPENLKHLLSMPDTSTPKGRRHLVLLTVLYDTAARVSELADICMRDVRLDFPAVITLHGKGGKIRTVPLMKPTTELLRSYLEENHIDLRRNPDMPLFWNCMANNIGFVPFSPIASGLLSGKITPQTQFERNDDVRNWVPQLSRKNIEGNQPIVEMLRDFSEKKNATQAQISLAWMLHKYPNVVPIPGSKNKERIIENLDSAKVKLTEEEFRQLEDSLNGLRVYGHRGLGGF